MTQQDNGGVYGTVRERDNMGSGDDMQQCIQHCLHCYQMCLETITFCLRKGGGFANYENIQMLQDCAEACLLSANFMIRDSNLHGRTCALCEQTCQRCADMCERISTEEPEDSQIKACAAMCRQCATSCGLMASSQ
jgi:hypothetical protein